RESRPERPALYPATQGGEPEDPSGALRGLQVLPGGLPRCRRPAASRRARGRLSAGELPAGRLPSKRLALGGGLGESGARLGFSILNGASWFWIAPLLA